MRIASSITIIILLCSVSLYGQRGDWYNDEGGFTFQGSGTANDPYLISSITAFTFLAEQVNTWPGKSFEGEYFVLTEDLDLGKHFWIPAGSEAHQPFRGVFDGNGKVIRNLYIGSAEADNVFAATGLFGHLGNGAKIENLTIDGGSITGGGRETVSRTGGLAGYLRCSVSEGKDSIVIRNCHIRQMKIAGAGAETSHTGGLAGEVYSFSDGGEAFVLIENCHNGSEVRASAASDFPYTGGIAGKGQGHGYCDGVLPSTASFVLRSCSNSGDIRGGNAAGKDAVSSTGGILGFGYGSGYGYGNNKGSGSLIVECCLNSGVIRGGDATGDQAFSYTGGLLGYADGYGYGDRPTQNASGQAEGYGSGTFVVRFSANRGSVRGGNGLNRSATLTGGVLGFASASASGDPSGGSGGYGLLSMRSCYSRASIVARSGFVGGLAGALSCIGKGTNHTVSAIMLDSYASGSINEGDTVFPVITGGIVGRLQKSKEASHAPRVGNCLAALSYLNGRMKRTFRIAGQIQGVRKPFTSVLRRNYAFVREGEWVSARMIRNGHDWDGSPLSLPVGLRRCLAVSEEEKEDSCANEGYSE